MINVSYFAYFGIIALLYLTYQDLKNNMLVDDRRNSFMLGIALSLATHIKIPLYYLISLIFILIIMVILIKKFKLFGQADINSYAWMFLGFGILGIKYLLTFNIIFILISGIYAAVKYYYDRNNNIPRPFYPALLSIFFISCLILKLF